MKFDLDPDQTAERLQRLSDDFRKLRSPGYLRSLEPEVTLSNWVLTPGIVFTLRGEVVGHPELRDGPLETSQLFFIDQELRLARTLSRWYRLGAPLDLGVECH
jgi:hypothetical protein